MYSLSLSKKQAFSLVEITLALGIISFSLVGILGLFPVAMKSAAESQRQTRAALVAQSVFADLASGSYPTNTFFATGGDFTNPSDRTVISLRNASTNYIVYSEEGRPVKKVTAAEFKTADSGTNVLGAILMVTPDATATNLSRVEVQVEAPMAASQTNRTKYNFVTFMLNR